MARSLSYLILLLSFLFLAHCSTISFKTDFDPDADFSDLKTFKIYKGKAIPGDALQKNPLLRKRIRRVIIDDLKRKGFTEDKDKPDFQVVIHANVRDKMNVESWGGYGWYDPWWGTYGNKGVGVSYYEEGTLIVDIVSSKEKEMVWRGLAEGIVREDLGPGDIEEAVGFFVESILSDFPPQKEKE